MPKAIFDPIRSLAHGSISGTYAAVGSAVAVSANAFRLINNTDGDMFFSTDGTTDQFFVPASSFVLYDISANRNAVENQLKLGSQITFYVKQSTSPSKNSVYIEILSSNF